MTTESRHSAFGKVLALSDLMDTIVDDMSSDIADACGATAVAVALDIGDSAAVPVSLSRHADGRTIVGDLSAFLTRRRETGPIPRRGAVEPHRDRSGKHAIFVMLPMCVDGQTLGAIALAIPKARWARADVFESCQHVANLAAMLVASRWCSHKLEIDLAELRQRASQLVRSAETDPLTGVENKASIERKVRDRLGDRERPAALLALDLDDFKLVNDIYGHQFGDKFLRTIGDALRMSLPPGALIGRTGGDEFCVLLDIPEAGKGYLSSVIQQLRLAVQRNVAVLGKPKLGKLSIGVSLFPGQATDAETLAHQADLALYASKRAEKNATTIFDRSLGSRTDPIDMRGGIADRYQDCLRAHFQPIVDFQTGACSGLELLSRWEEEGRGQVALKDFAWLFRDHRFGSDLTLHIVGEALGRLTQTMPASAVPDIWINVTCHDLLLTEFVFDLQGVLTAHGFDWTKVVIEVNENVMLDEPGGQLFHSLQEIRRRGGRVALDDFGTGYAGLTHLCDWPIDIIKIDRTFVQNVASDAGARAVAGGLVSIASALDLIVVAEGIETAAQFRTMRELGCGYVQGFFLSPPVRETCWREMPERFDIAGMLADQRGTLQSA